MTEGRGRILIRWGLAVVGLVALVALLPLLPIELARGPGDVAYPNQPRHVVRDINAIGGFREVFNEGQGHVRLVLLLSPT